MFGSASSTSKGKVFGSARLHPYAQQLPINPPSKILQPIPTRAATHRVLDYRSCSKSESESESPSPYRSRHPTSEMNALNSDGTYDEDDMSHVPMRSIEPISCTETGYAPDHDIKQQDTPYSYSPPCSIMPNINQPSCGANYLRLMAKHQSFDLSLPLPNNWTCYDDISCEQRERLDRGPVKFLDLADIGTPRTQAQVDALLYPRVCIDSDANIVDRFVTDCEKTSGRVYDRLFRRELARITTYAGNSFRRPVSGQVFDVYTGDIRKRCLYDDLRDANAKTEGCLEVIDDECDLDYEAVPDYRFAKIAEAGPSQERNLNPYDYDAGRY